MSTNDILKVREQLQRYKTKICKKAADECKFHHFA